MLFKRLFIFFNFDLLKNTAVDKKAIERTFNKFSEKKVLIVGDAMIDSYLYGRVERISPEAPIPIVSVSEEEDRLGGAGNVARNIKELGAVPILFSVVGEDPRGHLFHDLLEKRGIDTSGVVYSKYRRTTLKTRIISAGQHIVRIDNETTGPLTEDLENEVIKGISKTIENEKIDVVIFVDYDKGMLTTNVVSKVKALADQHKILTVVDPKKQNFLAYKGFDLFKPNFKEFNDGLGLHLSKGDINGLKNAAQILHSVNQHRNVFITLSELGVFYSNNTEQLHIPAEIRYIADVSGAGDTVVAVAALCLASGLSIKELAIFSNLAGGLVCEQVGVVPVNMNQLKSEIGEYFLKQ